MSKPAVETYQVPWELDQLLTLYKALAPARVLEVGCWHGGTLWHWLQQPGVTVVAVDDEMRSADDWQGWAMDAGSTLHSFQGSSHDPDVIWEVSGLGPYDFVFIDADHSYSSVKADWFNYGQMVAPGGALVFHDILPRPNYGVSEVWAEVKAMPNARWIEIGQEAVEPGNEGRCGIGVLFL
jgi:cephalosporin hydroxylase